MTNNNKLIIGLLILFISAGIISCKKDNSCQGCTGNNRPPVANAGPDQTIFLPVNSVNLNGSASNDPDNNIASYSWKIVSGPGSPVISNLNVAQTQVTNLIEGNYLFELKVTDAFGLFDTDTLLVTVSYTTPPSSPCGTLCSLSNTCRGFWVCMEIPVVQSTLYTCADFYQAYGASVATSNKVFYAGGADDFSNYGGSLDGGIEYDPVGHSIRCFKLSVPRCYLTGAKAGNKILFAGGKEISNYTNHPVFNTVDIFDEQTLAPAAATLSEARANLAAVSLDDKAYFIGGKTEYGYSSKIDIYNSANNTWQVISMPRERGYAGASVIGNKIYIAGGQNSTGYIRTLDIYDTQSGQWTSSEYLNDHPFASVVAINNKLIVAGGDGLNNKSADIYNSATGQWTSVNLGSSRFNITATYCNNKIVFLGGNYSFDGIRYTNESGDVDVYNYNTDSWSQGSISPGVGGVMAAAIGDEIIYTGFMWDNGLTIANTMIRVKL